MTLFAPPGDAGTARPALARQQLAALLEVDSELGRGMRPDRREAARRQIPVRVVTIPAGPWPLEQVLARAGDLGILIVDGMVGRELLAHDVASMELLGPGDLLKPEQESADFELLAAVVRWSALADTRLAILDGQLAASLQAYPELYGALLDRCADRFRRLAVMQAISQLNGVDQRLLTLLWHLAERWGRVTPQGVHLPLALSHRMLGQLIGARRPTVSTALGHLLRAGEVTRAPEGSWLLTGTPIGAPDGRVSRFVMPRRSTLPRGQAMPA